MQFKLSPFANQYKIPLLVITCVMFLTLLIVFGWQYTFRPAVNQSGQSQSSSQSLVATDVVSGDFTTVRINNQFDPMAFAVNQIDNEKYLVRISGFEINRPEYSDYFAPLITKYPQLRGNNQTVNFILNSANQNLELIDNRKFSPSVANNNSDNSALKKLFYLNQANRTKWVYMTDQNRVFISEPEFVNPVLLFTESSRIRPFDLVSTPESEQLYLIAMPGIREFKPIIKDSAIPEERVFNLHEFKFLTVINKSKLMEKAVNQNREELLLTDTYSTIFNMDSFFVDINQQAYKDQQDLETEVATNRLVTNLPGTGNGGPEDRIIDYETKFIPLQKNRLLIQARGVRNYFFVYDLDTNQISGSSLPITNKGFENLTGSYCIYSTSVCYVVNLNTNNLYKLDLSTSSSAGYSFSTSNFEFGRIPDFDLNQIFQTLILQNKSITDMLDYQNGKIGIWYLGKFYAME